MKLIKVTLMLDYLTLFQLIFFLLFTLILFILSLDKNIFSCQKCKNEYMSFKELEEHLKTHQLKSKSTNLHLTCGKYIKYSFFHHITYLSFRFIENIKIKY